jgi:hypothetical protein
VATGARRRAGELAGGLVFLGLVACRDPFPSPERPPVRLYQEGRYQTTWDDRSQLIRRLTDADGDGRAERVELFTPERRVRRAEIDTDLDGAVDRWEEYGSEGELTRLGLARRAPGRVDLWIVPDGRGGLRRRELDQDGDGSFDRFESYEGATLVRVAMDADRDGHVERWQEWRNRALLAESFDIDADGAPDRRLRYGPDGRVVAVEAAR